MTTTVEAAALAGLTPETFRKAMQRERAKGRDYRMPVDQWYPGNNPAWDEAHVRAWAARRDG